MRLGQEHPRHTTSMNTLHEHGRGLTEIRQIISAASISDGAKKTAIDIFEELGASRGKDSQYIHRETCTFTKSARSMRW